MDAILPGLYTSAPQKLSFAPQQTVRAFLLRRAGGNLLIYSTEGVAGEADEINSLGGVSRRYLNHRHGAAFGCAAVAAAFDAPLHCHANERRSVAENCSVAATFSERHTLDGDFEIVPTPGHTNGATAFLWNNGGQRCLFTGDTIYFGENGDWIAAVLGSSDRQAYIESLELVRTLDFDVLVPWAAPAGEPVHALTDRSDSRRRINAILDRLRAGGDH